MRYLDLLEKCLTNTIYRDPPCDPTLATVFHWTQRINGRDWPSQAHTMIGCKRIHQLREACETVLREDIEGDFIETGVWRGGACIMMAAVLAEYGEGYSKGRKVWCADSFKGLPNTGESNLHVYPQLSVSKDEVRRNFAKYGLLSDNIRFLEGWFADTLPTAPIEKLAILRLDGDLYTSTMTSLDSLYHKVSKGGFVIVDDYRSIAGCGEAVDTFMDKKGIHPTLIPIDKDSVYWRV